MCKEMFDSDFRMAKSIVEGTLEFVCPVMRLLVCPEYHEAVLEGSGVVREAWEGS